MSQFRFRFQRILDVKENEKEYAKLNMATALKLEAEEQQRNEAIYRKIVEIDRVKKEKQQKGVQIAELRMIDQYIHQLEEQLVTSNEELKLLRNNVNESKTILQQKAKEEKTWLNLKNAEKNTFEYQSKLAEQNFFDELSTDRYYRASISERW